MKIQTLARLMRSHHRKSKSWPNTGRAYGVTGGMAYRIAIHKYEPATVRTRELLGLDPRPCPVCHRRFTHKSNGPKKPKPAFIVQWEHLPTEERHKVIKQYLSYKEKQNG